MTDFTQYEKGYSPCAIQRKYNLTYAQGYELAERLKKTRELELEVRRENAQLKELLKECKDVIKNVDTYYGNYDSTNGYLVINKINEALK